MAVAPELFQSAMNAQIQIQRPDLEGNRSGSGSQGYWRKPSGEIVFGSYTANGMRSYGSKNFQMLAQYRQFTTAYDSQRRLDVMTDPYRPMLEQGGIKEFTREQIVELGWHRKPHPVLQRAIQSLMATLNKTEEEALLMVMPQLEGFERTDIPCRLCPGRMFNSADELDRHEVIHREDVQTRRLSDSISAALRGSSDANAPVLQMLAQAIQSLAVGQAESRQFQQDLAANVQALLAATPVAKTGK